ncbi:MAG: phosphatidylglycerophosphatase A [Pikeienuella sp.]
MIAYQIVIGFGLGKLPEMPGTWASLAAIPLAWGLHALGGFALVAAATVALVGLGIWALAQVPGAADDPGEIVIDELAGMMLAIWPLSLGLTLAGTGPWVFPWPGWVLAFVVFRALDIFKPWPVSRAERVGGIWGVMLDDLVAGGITALLATLAAAVAHGWI